MEAATGSGLGEKTHHPPTSSSSTISTTSAPPVIVRVKRKRDADSASVQPFLLLKTRHSPKRARTATTAKQNVNLAVDSSKAKDKEDISLVYCELVESGNSPENVNLEEIVSRRLKRPLGEASENGSSVLKKMKVIDLEQTPAGLQRSESAAADLLSSITLNGKPLRASNNPNPNISPPELDFHIWSAFQMGTFTELLRVFKMDNTGVNYVRQVGPAVTALMAAVYHGNEEVVGELLKLGAKPSIGDGAGRDAFRMLEHIEDKEKVGRIKELLEKAKDEEEDSEEVVFDIYRVKSQEETVVNDMSHFWGKDNVAVEVVQEVFEWTELGIGGVEGLGHEELVYQGAGEGLEDEEAQEDPDDENYRFNDYPDEEDCCGAGFEGSDAGTDSTTSGMHQREDYYGDDDFSFG